MKNQKKDIPKKDRKNEPIDTKTVEEKGEFIEELERKTKNEETLKIILSLEESIIKKAKALGII